MLLSPEKNFGVEFWDKLYDAKDRNSETYVTVVAVVQQETLQELAWEVEFDEAYDVRGLVSFSETGLPNEKMMNYFVGQEVRVIIKGIDKKKNLVACTRREVVEQYRERILRMVEEGQQIEACVTFVTDIWVGLDLGGGVLVDLDRKRAGTSRSIPLNAIYHEGQRVKVTIEKIDRDSGMISVSPVDPWQEIRYARGDKVLGEVVHLGEKNIFVAIRAGIVGIAPYPANGKSPGIGDRFKFKVNEYDPDKKSLSLGYFDPEIIRARKKNREYRKKHGRNQSIKADK
ncbi:MAG: hypothetical protein FH756_10720 [Firmicutes bacterium]|nr:hypothetical protein [Bacillota bacterium]